MTELDAALLKLEDALDYTVDPRVRTLIDVVQQAIEAAKQVMEKTPQEIDGPKVARHWRISKGGMTDERAPVRISIPPVCQCQHLALAICPLPSPSRKRPKPSGHRFFSADFENLAALQE